MTGIPVAVVDLGLGNLHSVLRGLERAGGAPEVVRSPDAIARAPRLLVPGQGAFRDGARAVGGATGAALRAAIDAGTPYLGICLGMQLLFERSDEAPEASGLGIFRGAVRRFPDPTPPETGAPRVKVPHMGWNSLSWEGAGDALLAGLEPGCWVYFVHGYHAEVAEAGEVLATADYGGAVVAVRRQKRGGVRV